jgi:hypothetical protein
LKWYFALIPEYGLVEVSLLYFSSKAFGGVLPARVGEFAPLFSGKYRSGHVGALLLVDRFLEACATMLLGAIGMVVLRFRDAHVIVAGIAFFLSGAGALWVLLNAELWKRLRDALSEWPILSGGAEVGESLSQGFLTFRHKSWLLWLVSLVATAISLQVFRLLFLSVGVRISSALAAMMVCVAAVAALLALTPWGLGIVEAPLWWVGRLYGLPPEALGAFLVLIRLIPISCTWLLYGLTLLVRRHRQAQVLP